MTKTFTADGSAWAKGFITHDDRKSLDFDVLPSLSGLIVDVTGDESAIDAWASKHGLSEMKTSDRDAAVKEALLAGADARLAEIASEKTALETKKSSLQ